MMSGSGTESAQGQNGEHLLRQCINTVKLDHAFFRSGYLSLTVNRQQLVMSMRGLGLICPLVCWGGLLCLLTCTPSVTAAEIDPAAEVHIGWNGGVVLGRWNSVTVTLADAAAGTYRLDVSATDPDGNLATFHGADVVQDAGLVRLVGRFQLGRPDGQVSVRVFRDGSESREFGPYAVQADGPLRSVQTQAERYLVTVGLPDALQNLFERPSAGRHTAIHLATPDSLPTDDLAYDALAGLFLAGPEHVSTEQATAIARWVHRGGRLYLSAGSEPRNYRESPLFAQLPLAMDAEPVPTRELTSLESYAGKTVRIIPPGVRLMIPKISAPDGRTLAGNRGDAVLLRTPYGFGQVTLLGLDITQTPLKDWSGVGELLRKMTDSGEYAGTTAGRRNQLGSTGITEVASQLSAGLEHFAAVRRTSPWWVLGGLIAVMLLVGPLDYWFSTRVWKAPFATWITFPVLLAVCAAATAWAAGSTNGELFRLNQLDVVDVDVATQSVRSRHWATLYSPSTQASRVEMPLDWATWPAAKSENARQITGWSGLPESSFGGMYRAGSGALQFQRADYDFTASGNDVDDLPLAQWSTAAISSQAEGQLADLIESKLTSSATGRLSGTVMHRLPAPLTDWFLAFAGRIYRLPEQTGAEAVLPLKPQQVFRVEQRNVAQRELRGFLTRTRAQEVQRGIERKTTELVVQQASYDPLERNLKQILPILTFFTEVGGTAYTGLTNEALAEDDLTPLLQLDRAILFGYLADPAPGAQVDGVNPAATARTTLVRIVLPVDRSKQAVRDLPKFEPK